MAASAFIWYATGYAALPWLQVYFPLTVKSSVPQWMHALCCIASMLSGSALCSSLRHYAGELLADGWRNAALAAGLLAGLMRGGHNLLQVSQTVLPTSCLDSRLSGCNVCCANLVPEPLPVLLQPWFGCDLALAAGLLAGLLR